MREQAPALQRRNSIWIVIGDLTMVPLAVYWLLLGYRRIGKPPGVDARYDARHQQWAFLLKFMGWGWIATTGILMVGILLTRHSF